MSWQCTARSGAPCLHQHIVHHLIIALSLSLSLSLHLTTMTQLIIVLQTIGPSGCLTLTTPANLGQLVLLGYNLAGCWLILPKNHYFQ